MTVPPAIILCGGRATRLATLFPDTPKALVPVAHRPFLVWQLDWLARAGVTHIHLAAGHRASNLVAWLDRTARQAIAPSRLWEFNLDWTGNPILISLSIESVPLGTGGAVRFAADSLANTRPFDRVIVLNGDTLLPRLSFQALDNMLTRSSNPWTILAVTRVADATRFGTIRLLGTTVVAFEEKGRSGPGLINGGVYAMSWDAIRGIPPDRPSSIEQDWFPEWSADGRLQVVEASPPLYDIGTPDGFAELDRELRRVGDLQSL